MKCVKCNNEVKLDISKALDEEGEVFKCPHCGYMFRYADQ